MIGRKWARLSQRALLAESTRPSTAAKEITINPTCSKKASPRKKAILRRIKRTPRGDRKNVMISSLLTASGPPGTNSLFNGQAVSGARTTAYIKLNQTSKPTTGLTSLRKLFHACL